MKAKQFFKSKTFWAGLTQVITGAGQVIAGDQTGWIVIVTGITTIIGRMTAKGPLVVRNAP